jgi:hypothetical protein
MAAQLKRLADRCHQIQMANAHCDREFVKGQDRWIALTIFEAANILLAQSRTLGQLFLRQALLLSDARGVAAHKFAHVHAKAMAISA